jgi:hypothetical protein
LFVLLENDTICPKNPCPNYVKDSLKKLTHKKISFHSRLKVDSEGGIGMYNSFIRSMISGRGFQPLLDADKGGGSGGEGGSGEGDKGGEGGGTGAGGSNNSLDELMKDPEFKKAYEAKLQEQLGKRLKKYDGIDPEEFKRLKAEEDKKKEESMTEAQKLQAKIDAMEAERKSFEVREIDIAVKEFAISESLDPKLIARLIDKSGIKKSGENFEGIKEAVEAVQSEFPALFQADDGDEGGGSGGASGGQGSSFKLPKQKGNNPPKKGGYDAGKARAMARHKKEQ